MRLLRIKLLLGILCCVAQFAFATQIKIVSSNAEVTGTISAQDISRISLVGDRIMSVKANKGKFEFINDQTSGDVYVRTLPENQGQPLNAFIISEKGYTYKLLLVPTDVPSEQLFINNPAIVSQQSFKDDNEPLAYKQELVTLIKLMGQGQVVPEYSVSHVSMIKDAPADHLLFILKVRYQGTKYTAGIYEVTNESDTPVHLSEPMFADEHVRAIKLDHDVLEPGASTTIYIVGDRS